MLRLKPLALELRCLLWEGRGKAAIFLVNWFLALAFFYPVSSKDLVLCVTLADMVCRDGEIEEEGV